MKRILVWVLFMLLLSGCGIRIITKQSNPEKYRELKKEIQGWRK